MGVVTWVVLLNFLQVKENLAQKILSREVKLQHNKIKVLLKLRARFLQNKNLRSKLEAVNQKITRFWVKKSSLSIKLLSMLLLLQRIQNLLNEH